MNGRDPTGLRFDWQVEWQENVPTLADESKGLPHFGGGGDDDFWGELDRHTAEVDARWAAIDRWNAYKEAYRESRSEIAGALRDAGQGSLATEFLQKSNALGFWQYGMVSVGISRIAEQPGGLIPSTILSAQLNAGRIFQFQSWVSADANAQISHEGGFIALKRESFAFGMEWSEYNSLPNVLVHEAAHYYVYATTGHDSGPPNDAAYPQACKWTPGSTRCQ